MSAKAPCRRRGHGQRANPYLSATSSSAEVPQQLKHLELYCGMGRVTQQLVKVGWRAVGCDIRRDGFNILEEAGFRHYMEQA